MRYYSEYDYEERGDALHEANREIERVRKHLDAMEDLLLDLRDYFDQRADADCDQDGFIPNEEMSIMLRIDEVL